MMQLQWEQMAELGNKICAGARLSQPRVWQPSKRAFVDGECATNQLTTFVVISQ